MQPVERKLRIRAAMMLLWKSAGTGHYGYSGEIPVAVVRPLAAIEGPWTWTLLVGPPTVLQAFEAAGERPSLSRAQNMAEERGRDGASWLLSLRLKEKRHVAWSRRRLACLDEQDAHWTAWAQLSPWPQWLRSA